MEQIALRDSFQKQHLAAVSNPTRRWQGFDNKLPTTVLIALLGLLFIDCLCVIFEGMGLHSENTVALTMWFLLPPFAQPVSMLLGPIFIAMESPFLGRVYAAFVLSGAAAPLAVGIGILLGLTHVDSWVFDLLGILLGLTVKVSLFFIVQFHIANLEASCDLSFANACQADFLGGILEGTMLASARQSNMCRVVEGDEEDEGDLSPLPVRSFCDPRGAADAGDADQVSFGIPLRQARASTRHSAAMTTGPSPF
jgi:hypothetical protein